MKRVKEIKKMVPPCGSRVLFFSFSSLFGGVCPPTRVYFLLIFVWK
jgi:hypothetical protein